MVYGGVREEMTKIKKLMKVGLLIKMGILSKKQTSMSSVPLPSFFNQFKDNIIEIYVECLCADMI